MKKLLVILLALAVVSPSQSFAEEAVKKDSVKKTEKTSKKKTAVKAEMKKKKKKKKKDGKRKHKIAAAYIDGLTFGATTGILKASLFIIGADVRLPYGFTLGPVISFLPETKFSDLGNFTLTQGSGTQDAAFSEFSWGIRANWNMNLEGLGDGFYIGMFLNFVSLNFTGTNTSLVPTAHTTTITASESVTQFGGVIGYQWIWDFGLMVRFGLGASSFSLPDSVTLSGTDSLDPSITITDAQDISDVPSILPAIELHVGFSF